MSLRAAEAELLGVTTVKVALGLAPNLSLARRNASPESKFNDGWTI